MKKSSNFIKILLALVMVALVFSLAACGDKDEGGGEPVIPKGPTITEQLVSIIGGAQPLLNTLNEITADGTLAADAKLSVNHKKDDKTSKYEIGIAGNLNKTAPEFSISYSDINKEWLRLAYQDKTLYLNEPLTKVNSGTKSTNKTKIDLSALEPTVKNLMTKLMQVLADINIEFKTETIENLLHSVGDMFTLDTLLSIKEVTGGNEIVLSPSQGKEILNVLDAFVLGKYASILNPILGMLFNIPETGLQGIKYLVSDDFDLPELYITVLRGANEGINKIELGYRYSTKNTGSVKIELPTLSNNADDKVSINFAKDEYKKNAVQLNLNAELPSKDSATADLSVLLNADFSAKDKNIVGAYLKYKGAMAAKGFFNGTTVKFDITDAFRVFGMQDANGQYQATIKTPDKDKVLQPTSIIDIINNWSADLLVEKEPATPETPAVNDKEGWSILHHIYDFIGGKVEISAGKPVAITEDVMLAQLNVKIGKYVRFKVNEDKYAKVISNITDIYEVNKDTIKGIFDWNKETYSGGVIITGDTEATKDLLDVVNMFVCLNKDGGKVDITVNDVTKFLDYYVAALYYYANPEDTDYRDASDVLKQTLLVAKNVYQNSTKTAADKTTLENAEKAYKTAMEALRAGKANTVVEQLTGIKGGLSAIFTGGTYISISCQKDGGLNGAISILKSKGGAVYAKLGGSIVLIPEANVATEMAKCEFVADVNNIQEINEFRAPATDAEKEACLIPELWADGTVKVDTNGSVIYKKDKDGVPIYSDYYENGNKILGQLLDIFYKYLAISTPVVPAA